MTSKLIRRGDFGFAGGTTGISTMAVLRKTIEITAGEVANELSRRGISPDEPVTLTIEAELIPGRRESRKLVIAAGLTDDDIDRLIKRAQQEVEPLLPR